MTEIEMKPSVLIVDDESHVREAIRLLIDWKEYAIETILEASDGHEAIQLIEAHKPEIIFTDMMMSGMNGVQLLKWIHQQHPQAKVVVISGHDDFEFVRNTVKYGGMDYLLKPIDRDELRDTLDKAVASWQEDEQLRQQKQQQNIQMNQFKPVYWDKLFSNLIEQPSYWNSISADVRKEFHLDNPIRQGKIVILSLETVTQKIKQKFQRQMDLLYFTLTNICNEILKDAKMGYAFRFWNREKEIILFIWEHFDAMEQKLHQINEGMYRTLGGRFHFGIGATAPFPDRIDESYNEAKNAIKQRNLLESNKWFHQPQTPQADKIMSSLHFSDVEEDIRLAIQSANPKQIRHAVSIWMNKVKQLQHISVVQIELWSHEFQVFQKQWLKDVDADVQQSGSSDSQPNGEKENPLFISLNDAGKIAFDSWEEELNLYFLKIAQQLTKAQQKNDHKVIYDIAEFIQQNYHRDVSLQFIADRFYLSREYISRKFKQEMNENISDYIGKIRIDKAKLLLHNPHLKISQISEMVGYQDEKYFSKVFKKLAGISPNEYRKTST
ncbi:response regulator transcription factor [Marinicrinis sediminis]|uniref:Response regulator n=1 Tax=Marinicrinis sediminis TaxID=1652465 RepID=A0ABW5R9F1_9BACL